MELTAHQQLINAEDDWLLCQMHRASLLGVTLLAALFWIVAGVVEAAYLLRNETLNDLRTDRRWKRRERWGIVGFLVMLAPWAAIMALVLYR